MMTDAVIPVFTDTTEATKRLLSQRNQMKVDLPPSVQASVRNIFGADLTPDEVAAHILDDVRRRGDNALHEYARRIDGVEVHQLVVEPAEMKSAWDVTPPTLRRALELAVERVRAFHLLQPKLSWIDWQGDGGALGQIVRPLGRIGIYAPGGRAPYPSSLIMAAVPARVAGVKQVFVATPPGNDGSVPSVILAAAHISQVDRVFKIGGAQAIAALAYGTESIPRVDKILGPGNAFVVAAKRQVFGEVAIDQLPGPTETLVIADESANPEWVAADLLAQAEHDPLASAVLLTPSVELAQAVQQDIESQLESLSRRDVIMQSLARQGSIIVVRDLNHAVELANQYAPEHLCLLTRDPWSLVGMIENAGGIFVGEYASKRWGTIS